MNDFEKRKAFEEMLGNIDVRMFLKASPLESGERSKLDKVLSDDMYYESLYAHSNQAEELIEQIKNQIVAEDAHNFVLSGYKGCGKSTFVGRFLRSINARSLVINCDEYWEPREGIYHNIVMFIYNKILADFFPSDGKEICKVSQQYNEIFKDTMNSEFLEAHVDLHDFFTYFTHKLSYVVWLHKSQRRNKAEVKQKLRDHVKEHIKSGSLSDLLILLVLWDVADRIANGGSRQCCIVFENLDVIQNTKDVPKLVTNIVAFRNNIDRISESLFYNGERICDPTQDYIILLVMRETTKAEFTNSISHFSDNKIRFRYFMSLSEIYDLYDIISIRCRYLESIKSKFLDNQKFLDMLRTIQNIKVILENPGTRKKVFAIFNNDYRTCVEALDRFGFSDPKIMEAHDRFIKIPSNHEQWAVFGCRSIIFRNIFNLFVNDVFFAMVRKYEYSISDNGNVGSVNLDRMILLYLDNCRNIMDTEEFGGREYVSINVLFTEILKFCQNPDTIVDAVWNMYDLQNTDMWNHLITFDDMESITNNELKAEMDAVLQKKEDVNFAKIKITLAGQVYLNNILPHFEYYAARSEYGKGYSLFAFTAEELCNLKKIEKLIRNERREVANCCKRLFLFFKDVFERIDEFKGKNFLKTKFASIKVSDNKRSITRMYHCEKIIYSNIGYLDNFRFFAFYILDQILQQGCFESDIDVTYIVRKVREGNKDFIEAISKTLISGYVQSVIIKRNFDETKSNQTIEIRKNNGQVEICEVPLNLLVKMIKIGYNKVIIDSIVELMRLFGFYNGKQITMYSNGTENIYKAFDACINSIIASSKYDDFKTRISTEEGERILVEMRTEKKKVIQKERMIANQERKKQRGL